MEKGLTLWSSLLNMVHTVRVAELGGGEAGALLKDPAEMIQAGKAAQFADGGNGVGGVQQHFLCLLHMQQLLLRLLQ